MRKLDAEIEKFRAIGFEQKGTTGYGECIFMIHTSMVHHRFGDVHLHIAQSPDDSEDGRVEFYPFNEFGALQNYKF